MDADLGSGLVKQRVARPQSGRSGGFRTILVFRAADRAVFLFGFAKNVQENISAEDLRELKLLGRRILRLTHDELDDAVRTGAFVEVKHDS